MNFLKKFFKPQPPQNIEIKLDDSSEKALDDLFVEYFIAKGGRFLYCQSKSDITEQLLNILEQENWHKPLTYSNKLKKLMQGIGVKATDAIDNSDCFFTKCEHLIAEDGSILFSSKQLKDHRLTTLPQNFIVYAKTSQLVHNKGDSLAGIKNRYQKKGIPSNIAAVKYFNPLEKAADFISSGNTNDKQLYLLLLEDL